MKIPNQRLDEDQQIEKLEQEIADKKKALAALRAKITPLEVQDYTFEDQSGKSVKLSELFKDKQELILVSNMGKVCKYCTLWADNFNGIKKPLSDRAAFAVVSPDAPSVQKEFAASRGWKFKMLSHQNNDWASDFGFKAENHFQPGVLSYTKGDNGKIYFHSKAYFGPGDNYCNMWDFIDLLPKGVNAWVPKYNY
jgi:predicted dithiol-disulfide oxidoreductase (DUF899 family)